MQITCYECGAKYNVDDDKVQGRNFKFRCKGCSAPVFFRGPEPDIEEDPTLPDIRLPQPERRSPAAELSEMTGVRHENSVLFSAADTLKDLVPRGARAAHAEADAEGSGLIDIRALARAAEAESAARDERDTTEVDELVAFGPAALPLAAPRVAARRRSVRASGTFLFLCSGFGVAAVVLVAVMAAASLVSAEPGRVIATPEQLQVKPPLSQNAITPPDPAVAPSAPVVPPLSVEAEADDAAEPDPPVRRVRSRRPRTPATPQAAPDEPVTSPEPATPTPPAVDSVAASEAAEQSELDRLIAGALDDPRQSGQSDAAGRDLPQRPSPAQVRAGMQGAAAAARRCGQGESGRVVVNATIRGATGRVDSTSIADSSVSPAATACVARAVRDARFPRFRSDRFVVRYPFIIR